jgi:hypothetical protein
VWIARTAAAAADYMTAESTALELLASVERMRAKYGDRLDWSLCGEALWARALNESANRAAASALVSAISESAYRRHWGHTVLGLVADARGDIEEATRHLHESARAYPDYRLSAYGPSIDLGAMCERAMVGCEDVFRTMAGDVKDERASRWNVQVSRNELPTLPSAEER